MIRLRSDGRWEGRYVIGYDDKGLPVTKNVLAKSKRECSEKLKEKIAGLTDTNKTKTAVMTLGEWMDKWYNEYCKPALRPNTAAGYENHIYKHIIPDIGNTPLSKLNQSDLQSYYARLKKNGRLVRRDTFGTGLSDRAVRACHGCIYSALAKAVEEKLIRKNPADGCRLPPKKGREMQILSQDDMQRLLFQAKEEGFYEMFLLDLATGLRRGELLGLRWEDIDLKSGEMHIRRQIKFTGGKLIESALKTKSANLTIILPPELCEVLSAYRKGNSSRWLFPSPVKEDAPRDPTACRKRLSQILERIGCKHVRFHDLRHTFASHALQFGMDVKTLAAVVGHASVETTLNIYAHVTSAMKEQAARSIESVISGKAYDNTTEAKPKSKYPMKIEFKPYQGKIRKRGTGCISRIGQNLWEGRYSPRLPNGKRDLRLVYAHSEEECEQKLKVVIEEAKKKKAG